MSKLCQMPAKFDRYGPVFLAFVVSYGPGQVKRAGVKVLGRCRSRAVFRTQSAHLCRNRLKWCGGAAVVSPFETMLFSTVF